MSQLQEDYLNNNPYLNILESQMDKMKLFKDKNILQQENFQIFADNIGWQLNLMSSTFLQMVKFVGSFYDNYNKLQDDLKQQIEQIKQLEQKKQKSYTIKQQNKSQIEHNFCQDIYIQQQSPENAQFLQKGGFLREHQDSDSTGSKDQKNPQKTQNKNDLEQSFKSKQYNDNQQQQNIENGSEIEILKQQSQENQKIEEEEEQQQVMLPNLEKDQDLQFNDNIEKSSQQSLRKPFQKQFKKGPGKQQNQNSPFKQEGKLDNLQQQNIQEKNNENKLKQIFYNRNLLKPGQKFKYTKQQDKCQNDDLDLSQDYLSQSEKLQPKIDAETTKQIIRTPSQDDNQIQYSNRPTNINQYRLFNQNEQQEEICREKILRKKDRENLRGFECQNCKQFFKAHENADHLNLCNHTSRHRDKYTPPQSPKMKNQSQDIDEEDLD